MAHIVEFTIEGLAGGKSEIHCELDRYLNVFFGPNGCGKTSLIKILHSAMAGDATILENVPFTSAEVKIYSITYDKIVTRTIEKKVKTNKKGKDGRTKKFFKANEIIHFQYIENDLSWKEISKVSPRKSSTGLTHWSHRYLPTSRLHTNRDVNLIRRRKDFGDSEGHLTENRLDEFFAETVMDLWFDYSSMISIEVRKAQEKGLTSLLEAVIASSSAEKKKKQLELSSQDAYDCLINFLKRRQNSQNLLGGFKSFKKRYEQNQALQQVSLDIYNVENEIEKAMQPQRELQKIVEKLYTGNKTISFGERRISVNNSSGEEIGLATLSSGEKHLIRILVETLLSENCSFIIDEPELSLHIDWQRELLATMQTLNKKNQIIIATHSPDIMAEVSDKRIIEL